jgi:hypothetical protein
MHSSNTLCFNCKALTSYWTRSLQSTSHPTPRPLSQRKPKKSQTTQHLKEATLNKSLCWRAVRRQLKMQTVCKPIKFLHLSQLPPLQAHNSLKKTQRSTRHSKLRSWTLQRLSSAFRIPQVASQCQPCRISIGQSTRRLTSIRSITRISRTSVAILSTRCSLS